MFKHLPLAVIALGIVLLASDNLQAQPRVVGYRQTFTRPPPQPLPVVRVNNVSPYNRLPYSNWSNSYYTYPYVAPSYVYPSYYPSVYPNYYPYPAYNTYPSYNSYFNPYVFPGSYFGF
jgi:hypothetical protein